jgi:hypothetical protein
LDKYKATFKKPRCRSGLEREEKEEISKYIDTLCSMVDESLIEELGNQAESKDLRDSLRATILYELRCMM